MAERELIAKEKIEHAGLFNFPNLYFFAHTWLKEKQYGINEDKYSERVSGEKRNLRIEWKATRKVSDYFKFEIVAEWDIFDLTEVQVEIDGKKDKMNKGKVEILIKAILIKDPESKWDSSAFNRFFRDVYNKYVIPSRVEAMANLIRTDAQGFKEELKTFLELSGKC